MKDEKNAKETLQKVLACFCHKLTYNQTGGFDHSVFDTFVQLTEGRSAREPKQPPAKKRNATKRPQKRQEDPKRRNCVRKGAKQTKDQNGQKELEQAKSKKRSKWAINGQENVKNQRALICSVNSSQTLSQQKKSTYPIKLKVQETVLGQQQEMTDTTS